MVKKKVCFIAQFPPPLHGLSKAVETIYNSEAMNEFDLEKIDITNNRRIIINLLKIWKSRADLFYFTISQTKGGNLRDLVVLKLLELRKKKCLIHLHGGYYRHLIDYELGAWQRMANYKAIRKLAGAIVLGPSLKPVFQGMIADEKIFVVPNCVDDEYMMSDKEFKEKINNLPERKVKHVLFLSNFIKSKGYPEVLKMARIEKENIIAGAEKQFHFDFAGKFFDKGDENSFWNYIDTYGLDDCITYHGVVSGNAKRELLKKCDIFVLLTRYFKEGQPISILEAMGNGMVIITTDKAGIPDIVKDHKNGLIFPVSSQIDVKRIIHELKMIDMELYMKNGRNIIETNHREINYVNSLSRLFSEI